MGQAYGTSGTLEEIKAEIEAALSEQQAIYGAAGMQHPPRLKPWLAAVFLAGFALEIASTVAGLTDGHILIDKFLSFFGVGLVAAAVILMLRQLGSPRPGRRMVEVSAVFLMLSKALDTIQDLPRLWNSAATLGDPWREPIENFAYLGFIILLLGGLFWSALQASRWRYDLSIQNKALGAALVRLRNLSSELLSQQEHLDLAIEGADLATWDWDLTTGHAAVNDAFLHLIGMSEEEFGGRYEVFAQRIHPDDQPARLAAMLAVIEGKLDTYENEYRVGNGKGDYRWVWSVGRVIERGENGLPLRACGVMRDITHEKDTYRALAESEARFRAIVENSPEPIARIDRNGACVFVNRQWERLIGLASQEVLGRSANFMEQCFHPDDMPKLEQDYKAVVEREEKRTTVVRVRPIDGGEWRWIEHCAYPYYDDQGAPAGMESLGRDVTLEAAAKATLLERLETERALLDAVSEMALLMTTDGIILACNTPFADARFCESPDELIGKNLFDLFEPEIAPQRRVKTDIAVRSRRPIRFEDVSGGRAFEHAIYPVMDKAGVVKQLALFSRDITDTRRTDDKYRQLAAAVEQAAEAIMITDTHGTITYVNPAFETVTGYTQEEAAGKSPRFLRSGKHPDSYYEELWNTLREGKAWKGRFINRRKDGELIEEDATLAPLANAAGEITHYIAIKRDVTDVVRLERQLRQTQKLEAIGTLAGGIAHDFNNILSLVLGNCEIAMTNLEQSHPARASVEQIAKAGNRATGLVEQILTFARRGETIPKAVSLTSLTKEALRFMEAALPANISLQKCVANRPCTILADATQVHQVIINLCTNAYQAMAAAGGGELRIELQPARQFDAVVADGINLEPGDYCVLTVSDNGPGMTPEVAQRIYDPFFTTKEVGEGTGLGLSIVHGIVVACGGGIRMNTTPGEGTTFEVFWPAMEAASEGPEPAAKPAPQNGSGRILVIDDDEDLADIAAMLLENSGYEVTTYTVPEAALEEFRQRPEAFDAVVTDQVMPGMSGVELMKAMMALRPNLPVVLMTGRGRTPEIEANSDIIDVFLTKPFSSEALAKAVAEAQDAPDISQT